VFAELATAIVAVVYRVGVHRAWSTAGPSRIVSRPQVACFAGGAATVAIALGPMHPLADDSLAGHMVQHVVLITLAAPMLALGGTVPALLWALPRRARQQLLPLWRRTISSTHGAGWVWWAGLTILFQSAVMWAWHAPWLFDAGLGREWAHGVEHMSFLVSSTVMWWVLLAGRRSQRGAATLALFVAAFPGTALGAALLLSPNPWYPPYVRSSVSHALSDQQLAGVIMWSFAGLVYVAASAILFGTWLAADSDRAPGPPVVVPRLGGGSA
jgi:cytochrome c oxidase assembly factor CtaG